MLRSPRLSRSLQSRRSPRSIAAALLVMMLAVAGSVSLIDSATAQVTRFDAPVDIWVPGGSTRTVAADLDGDGDQDFVTTYDDEFVITRNPGDMVLGAQLQFSVPYPNLPGRVVAVEDIDGDGTSEIITTAGFSGSPPFLILSVDANGNVVTTPLPVPSPNSLLSAVRVIDFDDDGDRDIVATGRFPAIGLWWFENTGGSFASPALLDTGPIASFYSFTALEAADFNGDGTTDFAYTRGTPGGETVWIYDPVAATATPALPPIPDPPGSENFILPTPIAADFDGDGNADLGLISAFREFIIVPSMVTARVFLNDGTGSTFTEAADAVLTNPSFGGLVFDHGDVDGDGRTEIVTTTNNGTRIARFTPAVPGGFTFEPFIDAPDPSIFCPAVDVIDVDADGDRDVVTFYTDRARVYLNQSAPATELPSHRSSLAGPEHDRRDRVSPSDRRSPCSNRDGQPLAGEEIRVTSRTGATLTPELAFTDGSGIASFSAIAGAELPGDEFRFFAYRTHPAGTPHEATTLPSRVVEIVSGNHQVMTAGTTFAMPLEVRVFDATTGVDLVGVPVRFESPSGVLTPGPVATTDVNGRASIMFASDVDAVGHQPVTTRLVGALPITFDLTATNLSGNVQIAILSGDNQITLPGTPFANDLVVRVTTTQGVPLVNATVTFNAPTSGIFLLPFSPTGIVNVQTDFDGVASVSATTANQAATHTVTAISVGQSVTFSLTAANQTVLSLQSGTPHFVGQELPYAGPIVVRLTLPSGNPVAGETVTLTSSGQPSLIAVTDGNGCATFPTVLADAFVGFGQLTATAATAMPLDINVFHRGLFANWVAAVELVFVSYQDSIMGLPIIVAADVPQPSPGFVSTVFGEIHTGILNPGPSFVALDGIGLFGPADPTVVTTPNFVRTMTFPGLAGSGMTAVFQVYGYDAAQPTPLDGFVSNAVTITF